MENIQNYYENLAPDYDSNRFGNSYGAFIHRQESRVLARWLHGIPPENVLDVACGTGRLTQFAQTGMDLSTAMLREAQQKWPQKTWMHGDATQMPFESEQFQAIYAFHLLMHLEPAQVEQMLQEAHRVLQPGGLLIVDFPSRARRALTRGHHNANWHGSTAFEVDEWRQQYAGQWQWIGYQGVLWLPVHRIPTRLRPLFASLDDLLCRSFLKKYASYHIVALRKHDTPH